MKSGMDQTADHLCHVCVKDKFLKAETKPRAPTRVDIVETSEAGQQTR